MLKWPSWQPPQVLHALVYACQPLAPLKPLEQLSLPSELDGSHGTNRALGGRPQIAAQQVLSQLER
jgi:integrase/recombinase XerD